MLAHSSDLIVVINYIIDRVILPHGKSGCGPALWEEVWLATAIGKCFSIVQGCLLV